MFGKRLWTSRLDTRTRNQFLRVWIIGNFWIHYERSLANWNKNNQFDQIEMFFGKIQSRPKLSLDRPWTFRFFSAQKHFSSDLATSFQANGDSLYVFNPISGIAVYVQFNFSCLSLFIDSQGRFNNDEL